MLRLRSKKSKIYPSLKKVTIPAQIGGLTKDIVTDVVACDIPMLLSTSFMKEAESTLDFVNDEITMFGEKIKLQQTEFSH